MMTTEHFDIIVIGTGGVGSSALFHSAKRGAKVLGLDRFPPAHDRGSSHGQTRLIRQAYFEHPDYVPLLLRAYELWEELQSGFEEQLYFETGVLEAGPVDGELVPGVLQSAAEHDLDVEHLTPHEAHARWPQYWIPEHYGVVFERRAGFLMVERCVQAHLDGAIQAGATIRTGVEVQGWQPFGSHPQQGYAVTVDGQLISADKLIIAAGAWSPTLLPDIAGKFQILRKPLHWFAADENIYGTDTGCPSFLFEVPEGHFYGFTAHDGRGVKAAKHSGGGVVADPLNVDRSLDESERGEVQNFLRRYLPDVDADSPEDHTVCMYTMSPDSHFVIDRLKLFPGVAFACGLSGHGFKFTSAIGELLALLALDENVPYQLDLFAADRFESG